MHSFMAFIINILTNYKQMQLCFNKDDISDYSLLVESEYWQIQI
jgi:hypothetical protein